MALAGYDVWDTTKWLASSEGHRIDQRIRECGAHMEATANGESESQRRSYPGIRGQYGTRGWELVRELDLPGNAARIAEEARALLTAPECESHEATDLIIGSEQMALQIHESVGHAVELDRILGWEAAFAGTSWLDLSQIGDMRFGSELMNITADATLPGALGSFGYDDEGTPAHPVDIVKDGIWVGVLSGRDSAALAGLDSSGGAVRGDGYNRLPMVRMTNVGLLPGESSLDEMIAATDDGHPDGHESLMVDRRQATELPVRLRDRLGDQEWGAWPDDQEPDVHRHRSALLAEPRHARQQFGVDLLGHAELRQGPARADRPYRAPIGPVQVPRRAGGGAGMTTDELLTTCERVLALVGTEAEAEVTVTAGPEALTRFATSFIHQNVADDARGVHLRVAVDGRVAEATDNRTDDEALSRLVRATMDAAALQPVDPSWPGLASPAQTPDVDHWDEATATAEPDARAARVAAFVGAADGLETAGFCSTGGGSVAFANSAGQRASGRSTMAMLDGIARTGTSDGADRAASSRLADLDGAAIGAEATRRARESAAATDLEPGRYEVVLSPSCVVNVLAFLAIYGFNGRAVDEGRSFARIGEQQFDAAVTLADDVTASRWPSGSGSMRRGRRSDGWSSCVTVSPPASSTIAVPRRRSVPSRPATRSPVPARSGHCQRTSSSRRERRLRTTLVANVERGLLVTDFWYTRILDPRTMVVTGLTRNGVWLVESGRVTRPVTNLRFTQSYLEALGPDQVRGIGSDRTLVGSATFDFGAYVVPTLHLASWNFTGGAKG